MRWEYKQKTVFDKIKKRFAFIPIVVEDSWVWLETYYSYTIEGYAGPETKRMFSYADLYQWVDKYENN